MRTTFPDGDFTLEDMQRHRFGLSPGKWQHLSGLSAIVTGAGTGYGQAIASALAGAGARVALVGRRRHKLEETARKCAGLAGAASEMLIYPVDLCDTDAVLRLLDRFGQDTENPSLLVNSAALPCRREDPSMQPLFSLGIEEWENLLRTNVTAPWFLSREFIRRFCDRNPIRIVNLTSGAGWSSKGSVGPYNVSKSALNNLTMSMAEEARLQFPNADIQINALNPWEARTEMNRGSPHSPDKVLPMTLLLLAQQAGGPSGYFFCRDGEHRRFNDATAYEKDLAAESE